MGMFVASVITSPPIIPAHSHAKDEIIIPCFSLILLELYESKYFTNKKPNMIEIALGTMKLTTLNSKKIKSIINGIRHITPIPIISIPKFLATIFKSVLDIYLINYNIK